MAYIKKLVMHGFKSFANKTEIVFDKAINVIIGPNGSGKSCSYDTIVTLANGEEKKIGELINEQIQKSSEVKKLNDGIYVDSVDDISIISLNKTTMKSEVKKISKFIKREGDYLYRIKTRSGRQLEATKCHPIMSFSNGEVRSQVISELDKGRIIAVPRIIEIDSNKEDSEFARLMGYIIGDGYIASDRIEFVNNDNEVLQDYEQLINKYSSWGTRKRKDKNVTRIYCRDKELYNKIRAFYPIKTKTITSAEKSIPQYFLNLNKRSISNLLAGLFDTDGSVRKDIGMIEYCTKNKDLARQIQSLLLRFGILSKIKARLACATNTIEKKKREYYYLYIYGINNLRKFYEYIPLKVQYKKDDILRTIQKNQIPNQNVDLLPQEINLKIKELVGLLGLKIKLLRKIHPSLAAYVENRCAPTRDGVKNILDLFNQKYALLHEKYNSLGLNQAALIDMMDELNLSAPQIAQSIGLHKSIIRNHWSTNKYHARPENLTNFKTALSKIFLIRIQRIGELINFLYTLSSSDILWDQIVSIEKLHKPDFVYDLTVEGNHNFIANNIFAHNSNISDALCFVLGRLSTKSIRAAKARNLLFMGSKYVKPSREATVEMVFDNQDRTFPIEKNEVSIMRTVKYNGLSVYKLNGEVRTRAEIVDLLAQAGIDPQGFNLILQGQIQSVVKMHPEDRRKIIEEVAGIAVYESRKEKSLHELAKTEEKLREINAILRERTAYMRNLENERSQALKFKDLELTVRRCKATLLSRKMQDKDKDLESLRKSISDKLEHKDKAKSSADEIQMEIENKNNKIQEINKHIQRSSGIEQESLRNAITDLKASVEGLRVRRESLLQRRHEFQRRYEELEKTIAQLEKDIESFKEEAPLLEKKREEITKKKQELAQIEEDRKRVYTIKTELSLLKERIRDKENQVSRTSAESTMILRQIEEQSSNLLHKSDTSCQSAISDFKEQIASKQKTFEELSKSEIEYSKTISVSESEIASAERIKEKVQTIDVCPLCQNKMSESHLKHVFADSNSKIEKAKAIISELSKKLENAREKRSSLRASISESERTLLALEKEFTLHKFIAEKKERLKSLVDLEKVLAREAEELIRKREALETKTLDAALIDERYQNKMLELEEISSMTLEDIDQRAVQQERELERVRETLRSHKKEMINLDSSIKEVEQNHKEKNSVLSEREAEDRALNEKFQKLFKERESLQSSIHERSFELSNAQNEWRQIESLINDLKIGNAKLSAEREALEMESTEFIGLERIQGSVNAVEERLQKAQQSLSLIGSINLRALDVYEDVKKEYDSVQEKVNILDKEKQEIMNIINEIDNKKKRTFMKTFNGINALFTSNFSRLSSKGQAFLEIENPESIFDGGVTMVVKVGKGKFLDITSLSGGEQTLVALSLLFAIQEYKPYHFYILDEIDAALDKRNSERLSALLKQYMKSGQYIIITHKDALMMESSVLYGVSIHEGVSKILSLRVNEDAQKQS